MSGPAVAYVDRTTPPWAKGGAGVWWRVFRLAALLVDVILEGVTQGRKAGLPLAADIPGIAGYGGFEDVGALTRYLAPDAGVYQGLTELPPDLAYRVRHAQDPAPFGGGWPTAGGVIGVMEQIAAVCGPSPPLMRIVDRHGVWWSRFQDGHYEMVTLDGTGLTITPSSTGGAPTTAPLATPSRPWDWDGAVEVIPQPRDHAAPGAWWLILYPPICTPYGTTTDGIGYSPGLGGDRWDEPFVLAEDNGDPWAGCGGTNLPRAMVAALRNVILQRQTAGWECDFIIVAFDPLSFAPDGSSAAAYPDGTWGIDQKRVGTSLLPSRLQTAVYLSVGPLGFRWDQ